MQIFAVNQQGDLISAWQASRKQEYLCLECASSVRLRGGRKRHLHFYHIRTAPSCRMQRKTAVHLHLQLYLKKQLSSEKIELEKRFPSIGRIADVCWEEKKVIFEIQCSPINSQEILFRIRDYHLLGFTVVWILHEKRFNRSTISEAEEILYNHPHYFTNFDEKGRGIIYDQYTILVNGRKLAKTNPFPVQFHTVHTLNPNLFKQFSGHLKVCLAQRQMWKIAFFGDICHSASSSETQSAFERLTFQVTKSRRFRIISIYRMWLERILKKYCL